MCVTNHVANHCVTNVIVHVCKCVVSQRWMSCKYEWCRELLRHEPRHAMILRDATVCNSWRNELRHDSSVTRCLATVLRHESRAAMILRDAIICNARRNELRYGLATISRLLKIVGLFRKVALQKRLYSAKETYHFQDPTNRSHPISLIRDAMICDTIHSWRNTLRHQYFATV